MQGAQNAGRNQSISAATASGSAAAGAGTDAGTKPSSGSVLTISPSGRFTKNADANGKYLYETGPQFANLGNWTSSDFLFTALSVDPFLMQKRLGDGYYEQRLVREQMAARAAISRSRAVR